MLGLFVLGTLCGLLWALERCFDNPQVYPGGPGTQYRAWASFRRFTGVGFAAWRVCFVAGCGALGLTCELVRLVRIADTKNIDVSNAYCGIGPARYHAYLRVELKIKLLVVLTLQ
jgi:hypothetical protein